MDQKAFNERIVMSLLRQCAWVWERCTKNQNEGEFSLYELTQGMGKNSHKSKPGSVIVDTKLCKYWDIFNKTQPIDGLEFDVDTYMSKMTFRKDDGYDFQFSFPIDSVFDVTRQFCICNACQALMGRMVFGNTDGERYSHLPGDRYLAGQKGESALPGTCPLAERKPRTEKKFFCHYIGSDGNTPKRRSIELKPISELVSELQGVGTTPLWYQREVVQEFSYTYVYYHLYAQLSDTVAVTVQHRISEHDLEMLRQTDADIEARCNKVWAKDIENAKTEEGRKRLTENRDGMKQTEKNQRDLYMQRMKMLCSFDELLLSGSYWVSNACLRAFTEAQSPYYPVLQVIREEKMEERRAKEERLKQEHRQREIEAEKKRQEEEAKEHERLMGEAEKFRSGESISGSDVVELCRMCGIAIHLRTIHNLQQVIVNINGKGSCQYYRQPKGKRKPQLDGCYDTAEKLYNHLQEHYNELSKAA